MAHATHHSMKMAGKRSHDAKVRAHRSGGGEVGEKKLIKSAMREHDDQQHEGKHTRLKFKDGGAVEGEPAAPRLDRPGRAAGGRTTKGKSGGKTHVNVIVAPQNHTPPASPPPMAAAPHPAPPVPPPGMPPGAGGPPPGAGGPPMMPPRQMGPPVGAGVPIRNTGGRVGRKDGGMVGPAENNKMKPDDMAGGGSGAGRLQKMADYGDKKTGEDVHDTDPVKDTAAPKGKR